jgi:tRNA-dihydrouridine synthase
MGCESNNATPPAPAIAPGAERIDPRAIAESIGAVDPRIPAIVPGFDAPFFQAGLAGYSDAAMRIIARRHGCPYCITEALLDRTLLAGGRGFAKADLGEIEDNVPGGADDHPLAGQIMGSEPAEMAAAAIKMVEQGARSAKEYRRLAEQARRHVGTKARSERIEAQSAAHSDSDPSVPSCLRAFVPSGSMPFPRGFAAIDVNLACPVKKIASKSRGGHWLADPDGAIRILEGVREALPADIPVTVKMRRSFDDTPEMVDNFHRLFDAAYDIGCAWVTVHARTVEQKYVGPSRWDLLRDIVRRTPDRVIFGSGDVWGAEDVFRMIGYTGVSAVSVARGCIGNPWIFRQARDLLAGRDPAPPTIDEQRAVLEQHFDLALGVNAGMRDPEAHTGKTMRKFAIRFAAHHPDGDAVRRRFIAVKCLDDWRGVLDDHYIAEPAAVG